MSTQRDASIYSPHINPFLRPSVGEVV